MFFSGLFCGGCEGAAQKSTEFDYPTVPPICFVEDDPKVTIYDRKDVRPGQIGKILVIPLYANYRHEGAIEPLAIAHPFIYEQGQDIENHLCSFGQRENLRRLVFWVPGYFPDGMGRTFPWVPIINGRRTVVLELQRCLGSEQSQIDAAMSTLLEGDFLVVEWISLNPSRPYNNEPRMSDEPYNPSQVVRATGYDGRFYLRQSPRNEHVLWAFNPGTRIVNRLSAEERRTVADFAARLRAGEDAKK